MFSSLTMTTCIAFSSPLPISYTQQRTTTQLRPSSFIVPRPKSFQNTPLRQHAYLHHHRLPPPPPQQQQRPYHFRVTTPVCHSSCHSNSHSHSQSNSDSHSHSEPDSRVVSTLKNVLSKIGQYRLSLRVAIVGALFLVISAAFKLFLVKSSIYLLPLCVTLTLSGIPAFADALLLIINDGRSFLSVDVLMILAVIAALVTGAFLEGSLLTTLYSLSLSSENQVTKQAERHIKQLTASANPEYANLITSSTSESMQTKKINISEIKVNDHILVQVGQQCPCDGIILDDHNVLISISQLTGESIPITKIKNDNILSGSTPLDSPIRLKVTKPSHESFLSKISSLVLEGQQNKPLVVSFFDKFGTTYSKVVLISSLAIILLLPFLSYIVLSVISSSGSSLLLQPISFLGKHGSFMRGLGVLVVASPCALLIGAPVAYTAALSACARRGVLVKGGAKALDAVSKIVHIVFDKTGTLTTGHLQITDVHKIIEQPTFSSKSISSSSSYLESLQLQQQGRHESQCIVEDSHELSRSELARVVNAAAALEKGAIHPIAEAIQTKAEKLQDEYHNGVHHENGNADGHEIDMRIPNVINSRVITGQGVEGTLSYMTSTGVDDAGNSKPNEELYSRLGRPSFIFKDNENFLNNINKDNEMKQEQGEIISVLELGNEKYVIKMKDDIRQEAKQVIEQLQDKYNFKITVLTGDTNGAALFLSSILQVSNPIDMISNATPEQKLRFINQNDQHVLMVGDGINDGAALASALVGISFGLKNSTTIDASDIVLIKEDLTDILWLIQKAKATNFIVKQNLFIAIFLMIISIAGCVYGTLPLWLAVCFHEGGTLLVGVNGLRLLRQN